jgi:hypothetical protein
MHLFRYPDYKSEATQFIQQLKAEKPELEEQQRQGRALLWDKNVDRQAWQEFPLSGHGPPDAPTAPASPRAA